MAILSDVRPGNRRGGFRSPGPERSHIRLFGARRRLIGHAVWLGLVLVASRAPAQGRQTGARLDFPWPVKTREHVDLWLHGFAMVEDDSAQIPLFRRGYRDDITVEKNKASVLTKLDANRDQLHARFALNPNLRAAQFLALETGTWEELRGLITVFLKAKGNASQLNNRQGAHTLAVMARAFPSAADREWLQLFTESLDDESERWYHAYWIRQQRERGATLAAVDSLWQRSYRSKFQRFLNNTQEETGDLLLSLPLDGEGRTQLESKRANVIAVSFPDSTQTAITAIYVFAHEAVGRIAASAIVDNTTPAQQRQGVTERYANRAAVRGGLLLLQRTAPELVDGYCRYYLTAANVAVPATAPPATLPAALADAFPLPDLIRDALAQELDVVIGGI
jgi:hypothetical protein